MRSITGLGLPFILDILLAKLRQDSKYSNEDGAESSRDRILPLIDLKLSSHTRV